MFTISVVSQFLSASRATHWDALILIFRYLKKAPRKGLLYSDYGHIRVGFSDADWAGYHIDRRSTLGYCVFLEEILCHRKARNRV